LWASADFVCQQEGCDHAGVVIKDDLKFVGQCVQIVSQNIEIDCEFEGTVTGPEVVVSERAKLRGFDTGERVTVLGQVVGDRRSKMVALMPSARVEGEICHNSLTIAKGAELKGRCRQNEASAWSDGKKNAG
jgi:cytoskeletal protein CcmA (bactofilin family)